MDAKSFFMLVREMRKAQKDYFKFRTHDALVASMQSERKVDAEIQRVENILGMDILQ